MNEGTIQKLLGNKDAPATITYAHMLKKGRTSHGRANLLHRRALPAYYHHQNLGGGIGFFFWLWAVEPFHPVNVFVHFRSLVHIWSI